MITPDFAKYSRTAATLARAFLCCLILPCIGLQAAGAQTGLTVPPFTPIIAVNPAVADVGVSRSITVAASWPDACVPTNPTLTVSRVSGQDIFNIVFTVPQTFAPCAQALTPYSATFNVSPSRAGVQRIAVLLNDGRYLGGGEMVVQAAGQPRSAQDLTGAWHDAATSGSGFSLFHSHSTTDALAGAWYVFDGTGKPFWYLIQNGRWTSNSTFLGQLVELQASSAPCNVLLPACAKASQTSRVAANIALQVLSLDRIRVTVTPFGEVTPAVILADFEATRLRF